MYKETLSCTYSTHIIDIVEDQANNTQQCKLWRCIKQER
jgi:hypothetical protein